MNTIGLLKLPKLWSGRLTTLHSNSPRRRRFVCLTNALKVVITSLQLRTYPHWLPQSKRRQWLLYKQPRPKSSTRMALRAPVVDWIRWCRSLTRVVPPQLSWLMLQHKMV